MALLRRFLNFIYTASGVAASLCLIAILALIVIQMLARWTGEVFPALQIMQVTQWPLRHFWRSQMR